VDVPLLEPMSESSSCRQLWTERDCGLLHEDAEQTGPGCQARRPSKHHGHRAHRLGHGGCSRIYSFLRATSGSTFAARNAGMEQANRTTVDRPSPMVTKTQGS
jgi:hypothetical protein